MGHVGKTLRTPLRQVRHLGASHGGTTDAWRVHVTSAALVPLTIAFVWLMLSLLHKDYNGVRAELGRPLPAIVLLLFTLVGVYHMQIGMRSIILDYARGRARDWALIVNACFASALGLAYVYATLRIGL